jgi:uncharacterized membrane-anchored protein YjiN (DUF445 family)
MSTITATEPPSAGYEAPPPMPTEAIRARELRVMKRRATGLLCCMSAAYIVVLVFTDDHGWAGYVRAGLEASMVGGLADWFAVTALFRYPLGIPIPHTAVIKQRKDQFGETLGEFVQQNFLSADAISERVRASHAMGRTADWLASPENARTLAGHVAEVLVGFADLIRDEDVHRVMEDELRRAVDRIPLAPIAGRALRYATAQGRHQELLDAVLRGVQEYLDEHRESLRERFGQQSPWWLPGALEDRLFDRLADGFAMLLRSVNEDPDHELRREFDRRVTEFAYRLEHDPALAQRGEQLKQEILAHPQLQAWTKSLWTDAKAAIRAQAGDPGSALRCRLADGLTALGTRLRDDTQLQQKAEDLVDAGVRYVVSHFHDELAALVSGTIARWDPDETSRRLELLLGRDLQFIRINGTVVGGLAGLAIYAIGQPF